MGEEMPWVIANDIFVLLYMIVLFVLSMIISDIKIWILIANATLISWLGMLISNVLDRLDELEEVVKRAQSD
jgi:hypothetical protein